MVELGLVMRLVAWNCNMALPRKWDALMALRPDVAVVSECAAPEILMSKGIETTPDNCIWMGKSQHKGLGIFTFNNYSLRRFEPFVPYFRFCLPAIIDGPMQLNLLGAWAQNANEGNTRKNQLGHLSRAMSRYDGFLRGAPSFIAGDLNNNTFWDKPGWRMNHDTMVAKAHRMGLVSAYHTINNEPHGAEQQPTHYWRDRTKDGPTYHIDYIFGSQSIVEQAKSFQVGTFEDWIGTKLSDHVPLVLEV
jgi:exodeoxyribonuclease-3